MSKLVIMSRTHDRDLSERILRTPIMPLTVEIPPGYAGTMNLMTALGMWNDPRTHEHLVMERYVPWLDGAREYMYNLAVWREGY